MGAILYGLTDILHLLKILVFCDAIFMFRKREENRSNYIMAFTIMLVLSVWFYFINASFITSLVYIMAICLSICLIYDEGKYQLVIFGIWIIFLVSMLDLFFTELVSVIFDLVNYNNSAVEELLASMVSLLFIITVGTLYRNKYRIGIKSIGIVKLFIFTVLAAADAFVIMSLGTILVNDYSGRHKLLFFVLFFITIIGIFIQLASVILLIISRDTYKEKEQITQKYLNEQIKHYKYLEQREKDTKKFRHDIKNHMQVLSVLAKDDKYSEFDEYMKEINIRIDDFANHITMNNGIVDAILNRYYSEALKKNIDITISGIFPNECHVSPYDLCTIFSNVLSNAIEAAEKSDEKKIIIKCRYTENSIVIVVKNTFKDEGQFHQSKMMTTKKNIEYHGFGIENIKEAVEHNNGMLDFDIDDTIFSITLMLVN